MVLMIRGSYRFLGLAVLLGLVAWTPILASEDAKEQGWSIYQRARAAAGVGAGGHPVRDYSVELVTRVKDAEGQEGEFRSKKYYLHPNLLRQEIQTPQTTVIMIYDGAKAFQLLPNDTRFLPDAQVERFRADLARAHVLIGDPPDPADVRFRQQEKVDDRQTNVIEIYDVAGASVKLFVDVETHDVIKKAFVGDTPTGLARVEEFYSDFRETDGYRWHHQRRVLRNGEWALEVTTSNIQVNVGLTRSDVLN